MGNYMSYLWIVVIIVSLVVEGSTASLVAIWFIPSAIVAIILSLFNVGITLQVLIFFVMSLGCILSFRGLLEKALKKKSVPTNADALIGKSGIVIEDIDNINFKGQVKVGGQIWSAASHDGEPIKSGETVEILAIQGVKLIIKNKEER